MDHDLLLRWCSERAAGPLQAFRDAHEWLEEVAGNPSDGPAASTKKRWTWSLRSLQALGHVEVDWLRRRWHVAPPVLTTLTDGGGFALLCGARPAALLRRLDGLVDDPDPRLRGLAGSVMFDLPVRQDGGPALRLLQARGVDDARQLCQLLNISFVDRAADRLLRVLPVLNGLLVPGRRQHLPGGIAPARMTEMPDRLFAAIDHDHGEAGAYEMRLYDAPRYFYRAGPDQVFEAERGAVVWAELRRTGRQVLRYDPQGRNLLVPPRLRLPSLYERAATLRSGLLPQLARVPQSSAVDGGRPRQLRLLRYANIDLPFAQRLAWLLGQHLQEAHGPSVRTGPSAPAEAPQQPPPLHRPALERR